MYCTRSKYMVELAAMSKIRDGMPGLKETQLINGLGSWGGFHQLVLIGAPAVVVHISHVRVAPKATPMHMEDDIDQNCQTLSL